MCVCVGGFYKDGLLEACVSETASNFTRYCDMTGASIALMTDKEYVFMEAGCAFIVPSLSERPSFDSSEAMRKRR